MGAFLKHIRIDGFGALANRVVGPFSPGLNVVYGKNEAGKTTVASFVGGVLFGWEEARGSKNTYKPANAERKGSLFFANGDEEPEGLERELSRGRNAEGLQGATELVSDIDKKTYQTMFSLTSDELRSLNNTTNMTARLLTAGSGTAASPAEALDALQGRIASYSSRAAAAEHSIVRLNEQLADARARMSEATLKAEREKSEDRELHELIEQRDDLAKRVRMLNRDIERAATWKARLEKIDEQRADLEQEREDFDREMGEYVGLAGSEETDLPERVVCMSAADERLLRDELDKLAEDQAKAGRSVDIAQENRASSQATYDALVELGDNREGRSMRTTSALIAVALFVSLAFVVIGLPLFMHGRDIGSLSFTAAGIGIVVVALFMAIVSVVGILSPNRAKNASNDKKKDAEWVMLQDKLKLDAVQQAKDQVDDDIRARLEHAGLGGAQGSIRAARAMLDEAKEVRATRRVTEQRMAAFEMRAAKLQASFEDLDLQRSRLAGESGLAEGLTAEALDELIYEKTTLRDALIEETSATSARFGELSQELAQAREARSFDQIKLEYHKLKCRRADAEEELVRLLLAQHLLTRSIATWESRSQPEVYAQASRLMALMTGGAWQRIEMTPEGRMTVTDAMHNVREPRHLSLGTCQQLYLALRIALLMCAPNVGSAVPVLADDILVHFDDERRIGAAAALAELAEHRQVILFTCHREVVEVMRKADSTCTMVEL